MKDILTSDLSEFGHRELVTAEKLLREYNKDTPSYLYGNVKIFFNKMSGYVFLSDEDYNVAILNSNDELEQFMSCPNCGKEGMIEEDSEELQWNEEEYGCGECYPIEEEE